jgi:hypothetical protein
LNPKTPGSRSTTSVVIQRIQIAAQNRIIGPVLAGTLRPKPPAAVKLLNWIPAVRRLGV